MPKRELIEINRSPEEQSEFYLDYADEWGIEGEQGEEGTVMEGIVFRRPPQSTLEDMADFCDMNAQSRNNHEHVGSHRILATLLYQIVGREQATKILQEIAEYGGLDGMNGIGGESSAFQDFALGEPWKKWSLPA